MLAGAVLNMIVYQLLFVALFLFVLHLQINVVDAQAAVCSLAVNPNSLPIQQMFDNLTTGSKVFEMLYKPSNATVSLGAFNGPFAEIYKDKFELKVIAPSVFALFTKNDSLLLPQYPSKSANIFLTVNVICNGNSYPLYVLQIKSDNHQSPLFYRVPYSIEIPEAVLPNSTVDTPILAIDWDPSPSYSVVIQIENDPYDGQFQLDQINGLVHTVQNLPLEIQNENWMPEQLPSVVKLRIMKPLDYDNGTRLYVLNISAADFPSIEGVASRKSYTTLEVHVIDSDDMPPIFELQKYKGTIIKDALPGALVTVDHPIAAKDGDKNFNANVKYSFVQDYDFFDVDPNRATVQLKRQFPSNLLQTSFDLMMKAEQSDNRHQASTALLHIDVVGANIEKSKPSFRICNYNVTLPENSPAGTQVVQLIADDPDQQTSGMYVFKLLNTNDAVNFILNNITGVISVADNGSLDRERQAFVSLSADIKSVNGTDDTVSLNFKCPTASILIALLDDNDNDPTFTLTIYNFSLPASAKKGTVIGTIQAIDKDSGDNGRITMKIVDQDETNQVQFLLSPYLNGTADIVLDYSATDRPNFKPQYELNVEASDNGSIKRIGRAKVVVRLATDQVHDLNFDQNFYNVTVDENLPIGSRVVQVSATDSNNRAAVISYFINDTSHTFTIDQRTGWVTVFNDRNLDREAFDSHAFTVESREINPADILQPFISYATVFVTLNDINDNPPRFVGNMNGTDVSEFTINNTSPIGAVVGTVKAQDNDQGENGRVTFSAISVPSLFRFLSNGTVLLNEDLSTKSNIDPVYTLVIESSDNAPSLIEQRKTIGMAKVHISGVTVKTTPKFDNLPNVISISEAVPVGFLVYTIEVTDPNPPQSLNLKIIAGNANNTFLIRENKLYAKEQLDAETATSYDLLISYEGLARSIDAALKITVQDVNDNAPRFQKQNYQFIINDTSILSEGFSLGKLQATDSDVSSPNNQLIYSLESDTPMPFEILPKSGELLLISAENLRDHYTFSAGVRDNGQPPLKLDVALVTVTIIGKVSTIGFRDTPSTPRLVLPPKFSQIQYAVTVPENVQTKNISWVVATHESGLVRYSLETSTNNLFAIDPTTGKVSTTGPLDYEKSKEYSLNISACLNSSTTLCGFTTLVVQVVDQNDNPPVFNQTEYRATLPSDAVVGSRVIRLQATDKDSDSNGDISYALKSGASEFRVDYESGWITTASELVPKTYEVTVEAYDHGRPPLKTETIVYIVINGTNPHAPEFEHFVYDVAVKENSQGGTYVVQVVARDDDPGDEGRLTYSFKEPTSTFALDPTTGKITVASNLDFESTKSYQLVVEAVDHASFARSGTTVVSVSVLDVNDNAPVFEPLPDKVYISTSKPAGSVIFTLKATDADSPVDGNNQIEYLLLPKDFEYFEIPTGSNALTVRRTLTAGTYNVTLVARDRGTPPLNSTHPLICIVMGDSLLYPIFDQLSYNVIIGRNASTSPIVRSFRANVKSGSVVYQLVPANSQGFSLDQQTGELKIDPSVLDAMSVSDTRYFIVRAINTQDKSFFSDVSLTISLTNFESVNLPLSFSSTLYRAVIKENSPPGTILNVTVSVNHSDAFGSKLKYWIVPNDTVKINERGEISLLKSVDLEELDPALGGILTLQVFASNEQTVTSTILQVKFLDVDEFSPQFNSTSYRFKISETATPGTVLFNLRAEDKDFNDKRLRYQLVPGNGSRYFAVGNNGDIVKSASPNFDRETEPNIEFVIQAIDQENKTGETKVTVHVQDENDNSPSFVGIPYVWNLTEGAKGVGQVFSISATDVDEGQNGQVKFRILAGNSNGNFLLTDKGNDKSEISVIKEISRDSRPQIVLVIEARDSGSPPLVAVTTVEANILDVNSNAPKFYRKTYETQLTSSLPANFSFLTLYAEDSDSTSTLSYSLVNDTSGVFQIDKSTGKISLLKPLPNQNASYNLGVEVSDGVHSDRATVVVTVFGQETPPVTVFPFLPVQFSKPLFNFSAVENAANALVGKIDLDKSLNSSSIEFSIEPENFREFFTINASGYLSTKTPLKYLPDKGKYSFLVSARDNISSQSFKAFVPVSVDVVDVNDHLPEFSQPDYVGLVPATAKKGYIIIIDIRAVDLDSGVNAAVNYSLDGSDKSCFQIDNKTAQIAFICDVNFYQKNMYHLSVVATDMNGLGNSSFANLTIIITPPQDSSTEKPFPTPPVWPVTCELFNFSLSVDKIALPDRTPATTPIYVVPLPKNVQPGCQAFYNITGPASDYFVMNQENGLVKVAKDIDRAKIKLQNALPVDDTVSLNVSAVLPDGQTVSARFIVITLSPSYSGDEDRVVFDSKSFMFHFVENQKMGSFVGEVNATSNSSTNIHFSVLFSNLFVIPNPNTGIIVSNADFDYDSSIKEYNFIVQVTNGRSTDFASVTISLSDINDNPPTCSQEVTKFEIPEGPYGIGATVGVVVALDKDSELNALLNYSIVENDVPFHVDPSNGNLQVFGDIDRETTPFFTFHVSVSDNGEPSLNASCTVNVTVIDVNDNAPIFANITTNILLIDGSPAQTTVARVIATDSDEGVNGRVVYKLLPDDNVFSIGQEDGVIRTLTSMSSKRKNVYQLTVVASDLGRPPQSTSINLTIHVVNGTLDRPMFPEEVYYKEILPASGTNVTLLTVSAGTVGQLIYEITDGDNLHLFDIINETGEVRLRRFPTPDEYGKGYTLTVTATNITTGDTASTTLRLHVIDPLNNATSSPPIQSFDKNQYWVEVAENIRPPVVVIDLNSTIELDTRPVQYRILSGAGDRFTINETTGVVTTTQELDRENQSLYIMKISARPLGSRKLRQAATQQKFLGLNEFIQLNWDETILVVNVTDINDNAPYFSKGSDSSDVFTAISDAKSGQSVGTIKAIDPDSSSTLRYSIISNPLDDSDKFYVDAQTGSIRIAKNFDDFDIPEFHFNAFVTDGVFNATTPISVYKLLPDVQTVISVNRKPEFVQLYVGLLEKVLSGLTAWNVSVASIKPTAPGNKSDVYVYAVDPITKRLVDGPTLTRKIGSVLPNAQKDLDVLKIENVVTAPLTAARTQAAITGPEIALIAVSSIIILLALLGLLLMLRWWKKKETERLNSEYMLDSQSSGTRPYEVMMVDPKTGAISHAPVTGSVVKRMESKAATGVDSNEPYETPGTVPRRLRGHASDGLAHHSLVKF